MIISEVACLMQQNLHLNSVLHFSDEQARLEEQRRWLDVEMEKLLEQRRTAEELEKV